MEWFKNIPIEPIQFIYGGIAIGGGVARYLNNYIAGSGFKFSIFVASAFVSGFSGYMFALVGLSLNMPESIIFVFAGTGGYFGEQTMKLILEFSQRKIK